MHTVRSAARKQAWYRDDDDEPRAMYNPFGRGNRRRPRAMRDEEQEGPIRRARPLADEDHQKPTVQRSGSFPTGPSESMPRYVPGGVLADMRAEAVPPSIGTTQTTGFTDTSSLDTVEGPVGITSRLKSILSFGRKPRKKIDEALGSPRIQRTATHETISSSPRSISSQSLADSEARSVDEPSELRWSLRSPSVKNRQSPSHLAAAQVPSIDHQASHNDHSTEYTHPTSKESAPMWSDAKTSNSSHTSVEQEESCDPDEAVERMTVVSSSDIGTVFLPEQAKASLANVIASQMSTQIGNARPRDYDSDDVQEMLRMFAVMQGRDAQTGTDRKAAAIFRQQRKLITERFLCTVAHSTTMSDASDSSIVKEHFSESRPQLHDRIESWVKSVPMDGVDEIHKQDTVSNHETQEDAPRAAEESDDEDTEIDETQLQALQTMTGSSSWAWLIRRLQSAQKLTMMQTHVSQDILTSLVAARSSGSGQHGRIDTGKVTVQYTLGWNLSIVIENCGKYGRLADLPSLTSDGQYMQACTCEQYVVQVWPQHGLRILDALQAFSDEAMQVKWQNISPEFRLLVRSDPEPAVVAKGPLAAILELGELLAWLGVCVTTNSKSFAFMRPQVTIHSAWTPGCDRVIKLSHIPTSRSLPEESSCWRALFVGGDIAEQFPVAVRSTQKGIEMPLDSMIGLGGTHWATSWSSSFMLKGLCSMFYPVAMQGKEMLWHFKHTAGTYLSHAEGIDSCIKTQDITSIVSTLASFRHFVGWTPCVQTTIGSLVVDYTHIAEPSRTMTTHGLVLEKATISASQYMGLSMTLARGRHAQSLWHDTSTSYEGVLETASNMSVILFDTHARRGFLIDGCSALIHLSCARLWSKSARRFLAPEVIDSIARFKYAVPRPGRASPDTAIEFLLDHKVRSLILRESRAEEIEEIEISPGNWQRQKKVKITTWKFEQLVMELWQYLHKIYDYQETPPSGLDIRLTDRDRLEGWSFKAIVDRMPLLRPKMIYLNASGRGWADYVRHAGAITLMADNLGEILQNAAPGTCKAWASVPTGSDYLAASVTMLKELHEHDRGDKGFPSCLGYGAYWHKPHLLFEACNLRSGCGWGGRRCDRLQVLLPRSWTGKRSVPAAGSMHDQGAVVFGHAANHQFEWPVAASSKGVMVRVKGIFRREVIDESTGNTAPDADNGTVDTARQTAAPAHGLTTSISSGHSGDDFVLSGQERETTTISSSTRTSGTRGAAAILGIPGQGSLLGTPATSLSLLDSDQGQVSSSLAYTKDAAPQAMQDHLGVQSEVIGQIEYCAPVLVPGAKTLRRKRRFITYAVPPT